jgi:hypothetical protein
MKKQKQAPFPDDNQGEVPMNTNGLIRPTIDSASGKSALTRATGTPKVNAAKPATDNPYRSGWNDPDHAGLLGF